MKENKVEDNFKKLISSLNVDKAFIFDLQKHKVFYCYLSTGSLKFYTLAEDIKYCTQNMKKFVIIIKVNFIFIKNTNQQQKSYAK